MLYRFQVFYRLAEAWPGSPGTNVADVTWPAMGHGPILDRYVDAETPEAAKALLEGPGILIHSIGPGCPILDPHQYTFTREEAAAWLRAKATYDTASSLVDKMMADGDLPKAQNGRPLFTRPMLERAVARRMQEVP